MQTKLTADQASRWAAAQLAGHTAEPAREAQLLLGATLGRSAAQLLAHPDLPLGSTAWRRYRALIGRRGSGWPVAYLTGEREFYGRPFYVTPATLIPRPETELLVDLVRQIVQANHGARLQIADIGTGSGCIAVTLAAELKIPVLATDVSRAALLVARRNAKRHGVARRVTFLRGSLLNPVVGRSAFDGERPTVIVANLPYLPPSHRRQATPHEPSLALYGGGADGLRLIRRLLEEAAQLPQLGAVILEVDPRNARAAERLASRLLRGGTTASRRDLTGRLRAITWTK